MDDCERCTLKMKRKELAENITVDVAFLRKLQDLGLIDRDMAEEIKFEKSNANKVDRMTEFLGLAHPENAFDMFCSLLIKDVSWLVKELQAQLRELRGNLKLDEDVIKEAAQMVHKKFGANKRLGAIDKKDMEEVLAAKIQMAKVEYEEELNILRDQLDREIKLQRKKDDKVAQLEKLVVKFIREHEEQLVSRAHDMTTTSDILLRSSTDDDHISQLKFRMQFLMTRVEVVIKERDLMYDERMGCLNVLGVDDEECKRKLHDVLMEQMSEMPKEMKKMKAGIAERDALIKELKRKTNQMDKHLDKREEQHQDMEGLKFRNSDKIMNLQARVLGLEEDNTKLRNTLQAIKANEPPTRLDMLSRPKTPRDPQTRRKSSTAAPHMDALVTPRRKLSTGTPPPEAVSKSSSSSRRRRSNSSGKIV